MIQKDAYWWNSGFQHACEGGNMEIVDLMIDKGGHMDIVKLMIHKGATNIKEYFKVLIENGHFEILEYLENYILKKDVNI